MAEDDELVAEFIELLAGLLGEEELELSTIRDIPLLADQLFQLARNDPDMDLGEWLVEQDEVTELFIDSADLAARAAPIIRRMRDGDPLPQWNDALAAVIIDAPDDLAAREVFGDWLEQTGDPRGELVAIQLELERTATDDLKRREASLLRRFHTYLLGPLADLPDPRVTYRCGFFDALTVEVALLQAVLAHSSARLLRSLTLTMVVDHVPTAAMPATLRELRLHSPAATTDLRLDASAGVTRLEQLSMAWFQTVELELAIHPKLRELDIKASRLLVTGESWASALPALEQLAINEATVAAERIKELCVAPPRALRSLALRSAAITEWLTCLVGSPLLAQLRVLDLEGNSTLADAVPLILGHAQQFAHLELLDVRNSTLGAESAQLVAMGSFVRVEQPVERDYGDDDDQDQDYDDEDEDEEGDDYEDDALDSSPDTVPEDEPEEVDAEAEVEEVGVDSDAPIEERFEEPE